MTPRIVMAFWPGVKPSTKFLPWSWMRSRSIAGHQTCIAMIWLKASTARSRTATVISVCSDASVAAIV